MDAADIATDEPPGPPGAWHEQPRDGSVPPPSADIDILDRDHLVPPAALSWLHAHARAALGHLGAAGEVRVSVVNDAVMAQAHERYSGVAGTTDVLTFDLRPDPAPTSKAAADLDVDILVCADEAARQASARGAAVERELLLYIVHGVLHCLGEDDHDEAAFVRMHAREDAVLSAIGVGPVYAPPAPAPEGFA